MASCRTDLACEAHELWRQRSQQTTKLQGILARDSVTEGFPSHTVCVLNDEGASAIGKPVGLYVTLEVSGLLRREKNACSRGIAAVASLIKPLLPPEGFTLVVGLGNRAVTPDLIGPLSADHTLSTRHLTHLLPPLFGALRSVAVLSPGVLASTGVESGTLVRAAVRELSPVCVIAVDALASRSVERLCRTIQISDTGITPGSGVGNHRMALDRSSLGIPVIAVGVPTVVEASTLATDLLGSAAEEPFPGEQLFVTPREVDSHVALMARVIGHGISLALNPTLSQEELSFLLD